MSDQSNATLPGQPSAVAICFGIAITAGDRARLGRSAGIMRDTTAFVIAYCIQTLDSGTQTFGAGPLSAVSQGLASSVATSAESRASTLTETHRPPTDGRVLDHDAFRSSSNGAMSGDAAMTAVSRPLQPRFA